MRKNERMQSLVSVGGNLMDHWLLVDWIFDKENNQKPVKCVLMGRKRKRTINLSKLSDNHYECVLDGLYGYRKGC